MHRPLIPVAAQVVQVVVLPDSDLVLPNWATLRLTSEHRYRGYDILLRRVYFV